MGNPRPVILQIPFFGELKKPFESESRSVVIGWFIHAYEISLHFN